MRVLVAGAAVFGGMIGVVILLEALFPKGPPLLVAPIVVIGFVVFVAGVIKLLNPPGARLLATHDVEGEIRALEAAGLLTTTSFVARRAFAVEEFEDEGLHYFMELVDGSVLYLTGQYLYDYEQDEEEPRRPRRFPCTEFVVRRHRDQGFVVDIQCSGVPLEPDVVAAPFGPEVFEADHLPEDGQVIRTVSYDALKQRGGRLTTG
jgi:hypothetical protein